MGTRVLVTGGSGFLGINLIRYLLLKEMEITNIDIAPFLYNDCRDLIRHVDGDIRDKTKVDKAMEDADMVVHCAAALPLYSKKDILSTDVDGARNIIQSAYDHKVRRFVHISSTAVYGIPDHHPIYEDDPLVVVGAYGESKILAEQVCLEYRNKGMNVSIIRPKSFIGPERLGVFALLYDWAYTGHNFPILGNGRNPYQLLDVEDLCEVIYNCLTIYEDKVNDTFNIGAQEFQTIREDFQAVLDHAGYGKRIVCIPAGLAIGLLKIFERLGLSPLYKWVYETVAEDSFVSTEKAEKQLGFVSTFSNRDALIRNYEWYVAHLNEFKGKSGISHRVPWSQGVLKAAKIVF